MPKKFKIGIADDHILVRKALIRLINSFAEYTILFEVNNGGELKEKISALGVPDVVLMDINMPKVNGFEATSWLHKHYPFVKVLALSMLNEEDVIIKIIRLGAKGYILKTMEPEELKIALDSVIKNDFYLPETISGKVISGLQHSQQVDKNNTLLNEKEKIFLQLLATEMSYKEIAAKMFISPRTIDDYKSSLCEKFHVRTRIGLVMFAIRNGMIEITSP